ncbi:MAG: hypothetical protein WCT46_02380 [Candidatus Gracilibacteria bacterium]|jgi:hypothetical protein
MSDKLFSKFNIYDQIGYFLVGSIAILVGLLNYQIFDFGEKIIDFSTETFILWIIVAYFFGHVIHSIANVLIKENKVVFSDSEKEILDKARIFFGVTKQSDNEVYLLCYMLSSAKDITGQVQSFNAYYSLYRGWFVIFLLEMEFLAFSIFAFGLNFERSIYFGAVSLLVFLMSNRAQRFYNYSRSKTLQTFTLLEKLKM